LELPEGEAGCRIDAGDASYAPIAQIEGTSSLARNS